jgi:hypothetical protein
LDQQKTFWRYRYEKTSVLGNPKPATLNATERLMPKERQNIRILQKEANKKGDLFSKMVEDYFLTLGYEQFRFNVHNPGREIDIQGAHRTEGRSFRAECKATAAPIGGDDINKFVGSLDAERRTSNESDIVGYYLSLSGFTETAIQQEKEAGNRIILVTADKIISQLIAGRIIVPELRAIELATSCVDAFSGINAFVPPELLVHELGWVWLVFYGSQKEKTHFALIHGDGDILAPKLAEKVVALDSQLGGQLKSMMLVNRAEHDGESISAARAAYLSYLERECGEIQLDGLPADQEIGTRRLRLENIFVPLHLSPITEPSSEEKDEAFFQPKKKARKRNKAERYPLGAVLRKHVRIAVLGLPGGGKSTLIKRLATAYASSDRRSEVHDALPKRAWLPIFFRCRQLQDLVRLPITEIIERLCHRAELQDMSVAFARLIRQNLHDGSAILLIDGLDEISSDGDRAAFANQLRIFLARYPRVALVLTSREAGFRIVAGAIAGISSPYKLAEFDDKDIKRLTAAWHREVVGNKPGVSEEATKLANTICETDRLRSLAGNPLLLTTLLLVKRWVGQLPTRRTVLYGKAIEVLLMTWNVEGHAPLELEEVLPQLEFVAYTMMNEGLQRVSSRYLRELLTLARSQMPDVLGFAKISVGEFVDRVELRSSLLMLAGHGIEDGTLYPMYEFRHLTFQEYLAAKAIIDGYYPGRTEDDSLLQMVEPHLEDGHWKEVVPLIAVLGGRRVQPLIEKLIDSASKLPPSPDEELGFLPMNPADLLLQCFSDEVQVSPALTREGLKWAAKRGTWMPGFDDAIRSGKYSTIYHEICVKEFTQSSEDFFVWGGALSEVRSGYQRSENSLSALADETRMMLESGDDLKTSQALLALMDIAFSIHGKHDAVGEHDFLLEFTPYVQHAIDHKVNFIQFSALWAHVWIWQALRDRMTKDGILYNRILDVWTNSQQADCRYLAAWNMQLIDVRPQDSPPFAISESVLDLVKDLFERNTKPELRRYNLSHKTAAAIVDFYARSIANPETLAQQFSECMRGQGEDDPIIFRMLDYLNALGDVGRRYLPKKPN